MEVEAISTNYQVGSTDRWPDESHMLHPGTPMTDLPPFANPKPVASSEARKQQQMPSRSLPTQAGNSPKNSPATISFVRNRMFYARAALNAKGKVTFGLRHIRKYIRTRSVSL